MRALLFWVVAAGCSDRPLPIDDDTRDGSVHTCSGSAPACVADCASRQSLGTGSCIDGAWQCSKGISAARCPAVCAGDATHAEVCGDQGWECQPLEVDFELCPAVLCHVCAGFSSPQNRDGCICACSEGQVYCNHAFP